jgi:Mrp family chromosome partitioning ATPase
VADSADLRSQKALTAQLQLLCVHIESKLDGPSVIVVASAEDGDGKSFLAHSLADAFARAGHRTALLDATDSRTGDLERLALAGDHAKPDRPVILSNHQGETGISADAIANFVASARASFDYVIVETPTLASDAVAMKYARLADGVLLAVCVGRRPTDNDMLVAAMLEKAKTNVLGVVATTEPAIEAFEQRRNDILALPGASPVAGKSARSRRPPDLGMEAMSFVLTAILVIGVAFAVTNTTPTTYVAAAQAIHNRLVAVGLLRT